MLVGVLVGVLVEGWGCKHQKFNKQGEGLIR